MRTYVLRDEGVRERFKRFIDELDPKQLWEVTIAPFKARATRGQMGKWHAQIADIARETGNDPGDVKDWLKNEFGPKREVVIHGKVSLVPKSSTLYSSEEMSEMIDRTSAWASHEFQLFV